MSQGLGATQRSILEQVAEERLLFLAHQKRRAELRRRRSNGRKKVNLKADLFVWAEQVVLKRSYQALPYLPIALVPGSESRSGIVSIKRAAEGLEERGLIDVAVDGRYWYLVMTEAGWGALGFGRGVGSEIFKVRPQRCWVAPDPEKDLAMVFMGPAFVNPLQPRSRVRGQVEALSDEGRWAWETLGVLRVDRLGLAS